MRALDRKLIRDLVQLRMQALAIALVVASGVLLFVATMTTSRSLKLSQARYYADARFADVWSSMARAPRSIVRTITSLSGVSAAEGRIAAQAILDVPNIAEPTTGLLLSVPAAGDHALNDLYIRRGRHVEPGRAGEVLVSEPFAEKNRLVPGDVIPAVVGGHRVDLLIVGIALSPEFVMQVPPGSLMPDDRRFGVFWMADDQLAAIVDLPDAINEVSLRLRPGASEAAVIHTLDQILEPYGGHGAYGRTSQISHVQLEEHIRQLDALSILVPSIFLVVSAFLVNVVLSRLVGVQRVQIGMLKAFGYSNARLMSHYGGFVLVITLAGIGAALPLGVWLGRIMAEFYGSFFRFPVLVYRLEPTVIAVGTGVTLIATIVGAIGTLTTVAALPPSVAMTASAPQYRRGWLDRLGLIRSLAPALRMIFRNVTRRPGRASLTASGMAAAVAVLVLGGSSVDSINRTIDVQFRTAQREDLSITLLRPRPIETVKAFAGLPAVRRVEPYRSVAARLRIGAKSQDVRLLGLAGGTELRRIVDMRYREVRPPPQGFLVSTWLAGRLGVRRADSVAIEIREGRRRLIAARVVGFVDEPLGASLYADLDWLGRLLDEPLQVSAVNLLIDPHLQTDLYDELKRAPNALAVQTRLGAMDNFRSMSDRTLQFIRRIVIVFSIIIAFGVVYNTARISLAERSHEFATLRVLGFTRGEISAFLLGEIGLLASAAVPAGLVAGWGLSAWVARSMSSDRFRMPTVVELDTYAYAVLVFLAAGAASAFLVRRRLDRLDLVDVLKARE